MRDGVEYAERHDAAAGRRVGRDDETVERIMLHRKPAAQQSGAQVAGGADLQRHRRFL